MIKKKTWMIVGIISVLVGITVFYQSFHSSKYEIVSMNQILKEEKKEVITQTTAIEKIKVHITGEVKQPGLLELEVGSRVDDAIQIAGGLTDLADVSKTNLAYILSDGEKIYIPSIYDEELEVSLLQNTNAKININTANVSELKTIPGVGDSTANAIIEYRNSHRKIYGDRRHSKCFWNWSK